LVPIFDNTPEVIALILGVLAVLIFIFCTIMAAFKWKKQNHSTDKLLAINYGLFAVSCIMGLIIDNSSFYNNNCNSNCNLSLYNAKFTNSIFEYITQLVLVFYSGMILFRILNASQTIKIIAGVAIIAMSLITRGGVLLRNLIVIIGKGCYYEYKSNSTKL